MNSNLFIEKKLFLFSFIYITAPLLASNIIKKYGKNKQSRKDMFNFCSSPILNSLYLLGYAIVPFSTTLSMGISACTMACIIMSNFYPKQSLKLLKYEIWTAKLLAIPCSLKMLLLLSQIDEKQRLELQVDKKLQNQILMSVDKKEDNKLLQ